LRNSAERTDKFGKGGQGFPRAALEPGQCLSIGAAFGNPGANFVGGDGPILLLIGPDEDVHESRLAGNIVPVKYVTLKECDSTWRSGPRLSSKTQPQRVGILKPLSKCPTPRAAAAGAPHTAALHSKSRPTPRCRVGPQIRHGSASETKRRRPSPAGDGHSNRNQFCWSLSGNCLPHYVLSVPL